jgi:hypothetical protein
MDLTKSADTPSTSPFNALMTMFYEPARTFAALEKRKAGWLPMIVLILSTGIISVWFFTAVDFAWLQEQMLATVPAPEREQAKDFMGKGLFSTMAILGSLIGMPAMLALSALYFILVSKALNKPVDFNTGFSLSAWAALPAVLTLPLGAIQILMSANGQLSFSDLNPLSLNSLIFHYGIEHPLATFYDSISIMMIWNLFLLVIGYEAWGKVSRITALKVVLIPYATIYGIWFAFGLSRTA